MNREQSRRLVRELLDESLDGRPWEAIPDRPLTAPCFVRFATRARHPHSNRRQGIFVATHEARENAEIEDHVVESLDGSLDWFGENLPSPDLDDPTAIFLFKSNAACMPRVWELLMHLREAGVWVEMQTIERPGRIVYEDEHQVAVVPWADATSL